MDRFLLIVAYACLLSTHDLSKTTMNNLPLTVIKNWYTQIYSIKTAIYVDSKRHSLMTKMARTFDKFLRAILVIFFAKHFEALILENILRIQEIQHFQHYWPFTDIFSECTFHISQKPNAWLDLYFSMIQFLSEKTSSDKYVLTFQTSTNGRTPLKRKLSLDVWNQWKESNFEDITPVYNLLFESIRYSSKCLTHVPSLNYEEFKFYQADQDQFVPNFYDEPKERFIHPPDYILIPVSQKMSDIKIMNTLENQKSKHRISRVFLLYGSRNLIQGMCLKCFLSTDRFPPTIHLVPINTESNHLSSESINFAIDSVNKIDSKTSPSICCPYDEKIRKGRVNGNDMIRCVWDLFRWAYNITSYEVNNNIVTLRFVRSFSFSGEPVYPVVFGAEFVGLRYTIFIKRKGLGSSNFAAFVAPFDLKGWIMVICSFGYLGLVLKLTRYVGNAWFWMFEIIFEQGDGKWNLVNKFNWYLVVMWLLGSILIRNVYTSSLYTHMTIDSGPGYVPKTLHEVVHESNLKFVGGEVGRRLMPNYLNNKIENKKLSSFEETVLEILQRLWPTNLLRNTERLSLKELLDGLKDGLCNDSDFIDSMHFVLLRRYISIVRNTTSDMCLDDTKFVFAFEDDSHVSTFTEYIYAAILKVQLSLLNLYYMIDNQDQGFTSSLAPWYFSSKSLYHTYFEKTMSAIIESGIYSFQSSFFKYASSNAALKHHIFTSRSNKTEAYLLQIGFKHFRRHRCFQLYRQVCSLTNLQFENQAEEYAARVVDFVVVWVLYFILFIINVGVFMIERYGGICCLCHRICHCC